MSATKKRPAIIICGAVVILIGLFFALRHAGVYFRSPVVILPEPQQATTAERTNAPLANTASYGTLREVSGAGAADSLSRDEALQRYAGSIIQFDANCRAEPVTKVIPQKSILMLDNESRWQRTVIVGPRTYVIDPFDYALVAFNTPGTFALTCDSVQSVALIAVQ